MSKVRYHGEELKISDYDKGKNYDQLKCFYCNAGVSYIDTYKRNLGDKKITVSHYFRLKSGHMHEDNCKYEVNGAMLNIVERCADNELMTRQDNKFKVRLLLITDESRNIPKSSSNQTAENGQGKRQKNYIPQGKQTAYLSSVKSIMRLRTLVENNSDLSEKVELQFSGKLGNIINIPWNKFYYEANKEKDYGKILKYLSHKKIYHPICIDGYIREVKSVKHSYILKLEPIKITDNSSDNDERVSVIYFLSEKQIYESLKDNVGNRVVIYAHCKFYKSTPWEKKFDEEKVKKYYIIKLQGMYMMKGKC